MYLTQAHLPALEDQYVVRDVNILSCLGQGQEASLTAFRKTALLAALQ